MASQFQNLKNFIRHGKHARNNQESSAQPPLQQQHAHSDPIVRADPQKQPHQKQDFPADNTNVVAHTKAAQQKLPVNGPGVVSPTTHGVVPAGGKTYDDAVLARIIAEEKEARGRLPNYPELERWIMLEKMGDGAFSNVYRARDTTGEYDQVAIKVVRKYELNATQVCEY